MLPKIQHNPYNDNCACRRCTSDPTADYAKEVMGLRPEERDPMLLAAMQDLEQATRHRKSSSETEEALCQQKELSFSQTREYRWLQMDDYRDQKSRLIFPQHSSKFLNTLREVAPNLQAEYRGGVYRGLLALYVLPRFPALQDDGTYQKIPVFATGVQAGMMPAYSVVRFDHHALPTNEAYRGYWTVLIRLILDGHITEEQAYQGWGRPPGPAGEKTRALLYNFRNTK